METIERSPRPEKVAAVEDVEARLTESNATILTEYRGIAVKDLERLRRSLKASGGEYKVYKNTLVRLAARNAGVEVIEPLLVGPTGMAFVSGDVSAVAKVLRDFSRENANLIVKGGLIGKDLIDARGTTALAELPSREVLLAQIAGMLAAPMQHFASLLNAVPQKLAYALSALIESRGGEVPSSTDDSTPTTTTATTTATTTPDTESSAVEVPTPETSPDASSADQQSSEPEPIVAESVSEEPEAQAPSETSLEEAPAPEESPSE